MHTIVRITAAAAVSALFSSAYAQTPNEAQRNVNQQQRIESGLQSGQLTTREAGRLERGEAQVERVEGRASRDGTITDAERARIASAQNRESAAIARQKHDAQTGDPSSASSRRLQADVQRNENQQTRIAQGVDSGSLSTREAGRLERGQARVDRATARASADGRVGAGEQARLQAREDRQSARIYRKKHNGATQ